jgi:sensor histidine kinase YesM
MIPPMIAQPFVENSIEHGQLHTINGGKISVSIKRNENLLEVLIEDNGVGRKQAAKTKKIKNHKSMAIEITRERIEILNRKYMVKGLVEIQDLASNGQGTKVRILLPLKFELS